MKKLTMSLVVSAIVASGAFATSLEDAFIKGKTTGELSAYTTADSKADTGLSLGSISLNYETASIDGFKASLGLIANTKLNSKNDTSFDGAPKSVINVANISYASDAFTVIAGKQAIDLEWISDYHEAVVGVVNTIPNTTIIVGHTEKFNANAKNDAALSRFNTIGTKGANVVDATYQINDTTKVGAYYMDAPDLFSAVGAKVETEVNGAGVVAKYATTFEDVADTKDGTIIALDLSYKVGEIGFNGGFIKAGKNNGVGSLTTLGDNINPLDSVDSKVYNTDAKTLYVGATTTIDRFTLNGIYGTTDYDASKKESELNLSASWECKFVKNLNVSVLYANISAESSTDDKSYYSAQLVYSF